MRSVKIKVPKQILCPLSATAITRLMAKCVLPTPVVPRPEPKETPERETEGPAVAKVTRRPLRDYALGGEVSL